MTHDFSFLIYFSFSYFVEKRELGEAKDKEIRLKNIITISGMKMITIFVLGPFHEILYKKHLKFNCFLTKLQSSIIIIKDYMTMQNIFSSDF